MEDLQIKVHVTTSRNFHQSNYTLAQMSPNGSSKDTGGKPLKHLNKTTPQTDNKALRSKGRAKKPLMPCLRDYQTKPKKRRPHILTS